jgi:hypothetical protein
MIVQTDFHRCVYNLFNSDGDIMGLKNIIETTGSISSYSSGTNLYWNEKTETSNLKFDYTLQKGTYYIQFDKYGSKGGNTLKFKISDPNAESVTALSLSLALEAGEDIQLGGVVSPSSAKVTWKSSNADVATVSSKGLVTAVAAGKATITATAGGKTAKITIIVS